MQTTITPAIEHYRAFKAKYPDYLLVFRQGSFYEAYNDDASALHRILGLCLTVGQTEGEYSRLAGFPAEYLDSYLQSLVRAGHRVAVCEPAENGHHDPEDPITRDVVKLITPKQE